MYSYTYDAETGGILLNSSPLQMSKEPRPVYYKELDILGFNKYWNYAPNDTAPYMWAEANTYFYRGREVAKTKGGSLYTPPKIEITAMPEPSGMPLRPVDIDTMVAKNRGIIEKLASETIKKIYNTYMEYKTKVDVFYVAFSGGKDSVVVLDLVQRALPHQSFEVMFADTDMEFPTTEDLFKNVKDYCQNLGIRCYMAKSDMPASDSWDLFGAPARKVRWCCTVHKSAPVINKLCEEHNLQKIHSMMITGVRGDESTSRSNYDELSLGKKLPGQHSFHPILEWSSAEVYLYIYMQNLLLNDAYKIGFNRVGCIMCPNSSERHEFIKRKNFPETVDFYCNKIIENSQKDLSGNNAKVFLETGGWKTRLSGRELKFSEEERFEYEVDKYFHIFKVKNLNNEWKIWYKTIGNLYQNSDTEYLMEYNGVIRKCDLIKEGENTVFNIENKDNSKNTIEFIRFFKNILAKSQYCIQCKACVAACPNRNIYMKNGNLEISDQCIRCHSCLEMLSGCLYYNSIKGSKNMQSLKGVNRYLSVGVESEWIHKYLCDQTFEPGNRKTDSMYAMLNDAEITSKKHLTDFGLFIQQQDFYSISTWALILCNLAYTPVIGWYIHHIPFNERYIESRLLLDMGEDPTKNDGGKKARGEFWSSIKTILDSNGMLQEIGFGIPEIEKKNNKNGEVKKSLIAITRLPWENPDPLVILYSLYKFAEACGDYYQFTLTRLLDHGVESNGVSPTEIFGIGRDTMEKILNGLSINYPEFINATFTLNLDNITLSNNKTSKDVLQLF